MSDLTTKQQRFVEEYCTDFNGAAAARRAGYAEDYADRQAYQLLEHPRVSEAIEKRLKLLSMGPEEALKRLTDMARASWFPFVKIDEEGRVWFNLGDEEAQKHFHLIKKIKSKRNIETDDRKSWEVEWVEVELHDSKDAIDKILRAHGTYRDSLDVNLQGEVKIIDFSADND